MNKNLKAFLPPLLFICVSLALHITSMRSISITNDELSHIPAGYTYVERNDFVLNPEHPPLLKYLNGLTLSTAHPQIHTDNLANENQWLFGEKFFNSWNDTELMLFRGRIAIVFVALLLGLILYLATWEIYGWKAGCLALAFYLFNPDFIAHGHLVTTDVGLSCFTFLAVYLLWRTLRHLSIGRVLAAGLATALVLVSKFSGVLIFPMYALVGLAFLVTKQPLTFRGWKGQPLRNFDTVGQKAACIVILIVTLGLAGWLGIWGSYGFRYQVSPYPSGSAALKWSDFQTSPGAGISLAFFANRYRLVPEAYSYGFAYVAKQTQGRWSFVYGHYTPLGVWYYFLVTFLIKTPLALIILIGLGFFYLPKYRADWFTEAMLLLPAFFYWGVALATPLNIGHRHILPIYPFFFVFAAKLAKAFDDRQARRLQIAVALLLAWNIAAVAYIHPHYLAYFNEVAGGPSRGYLWLIDSNIDWGQDLKGLGEWRRHHPEEKFYVSYFGNGDLDHYLQNYKILPSWPNKYSFYHDFNNLPSGSIVAVSVCNLQCWLFDNKTHPGIEEFMARLKTMTPIDNIGYSILIYRMP